jgi:hypothetical protein
MPNLEAFILQWRQAMSTAPQLKRETLDELESHLRELLAEFIRAGMPEAEACQRAAAELGSPETVAAEFQKLRPPPWLPVKVVTGFGIIAAVALAVWLLARASRPGGDFLLAAHVFTVTVGYTSGLLLGLLGACFVFQRCRADFSPRRIAPLSRVTLAFSAVGAGFTAVGIILAMVWAKREWGRYWAWDAKETSAFCIFVWMTGFLIAHQFRWVTPRGLLLASVLGSNVVVLGWFGGVHAYGTPGVVAILLFSTVVTNLLIVLLGVAPPGWLGRRKA